MYVAPNTNIRILKNVPLDKTFDHTLFFANSASQYQYFNSRVKMQATDIHGNPVIFARTANTYQRVERGRIRIGINSELLYDCNYLMFQNLAFGNKWFYAFIDSVEYINDITSEITFTIDVMQTWYFDYELEYCFVEREHTATDTIGQHIEPEPVETGEYVCNGEYDTLTDFSELLVILGVPEVDNETEDSKGKIYDGVYGGLTLYWYKTNSAGIAKLNEDIASYILDPSNVGALYMVPKVLVGEAAVTQDNYGELLSNSHGMTVNAHASAITTSDTIDGYSPNNNKLYTYPYNFYSVDNANGNTLKIRYEFCGQLIPYFQISGTITQPCKITCRPYNYKGATDNDTPTVLNTECITLESFPMCSWNMDAYNAWVAQNSVPLASPAIRGAITGTAAGVAMIASGHPIMGSFSIIQGVGQALTQHYQASISADITGGNFNNGGVNVAIGKQNFYGGRFSITACYAKIIDDFFSRFGYGVKCLKIPYAKTQQIRDEWCYCKTAGCSIRGSVPADDSKEICAIYDNGITFWYNPEHVGDYNRTNDPRG